MYVDVTDDTFQTEVIDRSMSTAVVVDLWAEWCGPCRTLGPILEKVIDETNGAVVLAKVDVDKNPAIAQAFQAQSIPMVVAIKDGRPVNGFVGAQPEHVVAQFVSELTPSAEEVMVGDLIDAGDEESLKRALTIIPGHEEATVVLADLLITAGRQNEALEWLAKVPETDAVRHYAAMARLATNPVDNYDAELERLLPNVKLDENVRQEFLDILEAMGSADPRVAQWRKRLTSALY
jgi:putative thioredoxin